MDFFSTTTKGNEAYCQYCGHYYDEDFFGTSIYDKCYFYEGSFFIELIRNYDP